MVSCQYIGKVFNLPLMNRMNGQFVDMILVKYAMAHLTPEFLSL
jgi:hypothetical protein